MKERIGFLIKNEFRFQKNFISFCVGGTLSSLFFKALEYILVEKGEFIKFLWKFEVSGVIAVNPGIRILEVSGVIAVKMSVL